MITSQHVHVDQAIRTPQFYLLWIMLCVNVTAGIGILGKASDMVQDMFGASAAFGAGFGLVTGTDQCVFLSSIEDLFVALEGMLRR